jgi:hypothetical protein
MPATFNMPFDSCFLKKSLAAFRRWVKKEKNISPQRAQSTQRKYISKSKKETSPPKDKKGLPILNDLVKGPEMEFSVIPAKAGIQLFQDVLDPGFRRGDAPRYFLRDHQSLLGGKISKSFLIHNSLCSLCPLW